MGWEYFTEPLADGVEPTMAQRAEIIDALVERIQAVSTIGKPVDSNGDPIAGSDWSINPADAEKAKNTELKHWFLPVTRRGTFANPFNPRQTIGQTIIAISRWFSRDGMGFERFVPDGTTFLTDSLVDVLAGEYGLSPQFVKGVLIGGILQGGILHNSLAWNLAWSALQKLDVVVYGQSPRDLGPVAGPDFFEAGFSYPDPNLFSRGTSDAPGLWPSKVTEYNASSEQSGFAVPSLVFGVFGIFRADINGDSGGGYIRTIGGQRQLSTLNLPDFDFFNESDFRAWVDRSRGTIPFAGSDDEDATTEVSIGGESGSFDMVGAIQGGLGQDYKFFDGEIDKGQHTMEVKPDAYDGGSLVELYIPATDPDPAIEDNLASQVRLRWVSVRPDWTHKPIP